MTATTTPEENKQLVRRLTEEINKENLDVIDEVFAEDVIDHTPLGETHGREAVKELAEYLLAAFPDYSVTVEDLIAEDDTVALRATERGTHEGEFMDIEPTGREVEFEIMEFGRIEDGQIIERWVQPDMLGLMQQLGVVEPPAPARSQGESGETMEQTEADQRAQDEWDDLAAGADEFLTPMVFPLAEDALRLVGLRPDMRFLDVAAGSGGLSIPAARLGADVLATDISPAMIERLDARARDEELSNLESRVMDGYALELDDDTFDIAGSMNGVSIFPDLEQGLRELVRVTKSGGQVMIVTFGPPEKMGWLGLFGRTMQAAVPEFTGTDAPSPAFRLADPKKLRQELTEVGLTDVRVETVTWDFEVQSGTHFWHVMSHANPKAAAVLAGLSKEQKAAFEQAVDDTLDERSGGDPAVMPGPIHVGIGTK